MLALLLPRLLPKLIDDDVVVVVVVALDVAAEAAEAVVVVVVFVALEPIFGRVNRSLVSIASLLSHTANAFNFRLFFVLRKLLNSVFLSVRASFNR